MLHYLCRLFILNITKNKICFQHKYYIQKKNKLVMVLLSIIVSYLVITAIIKLLGKIELDK